MYFNIPLHKVEDLPITDYRLMLFTCLNQPNGMTEFVYNTPDEELVILEKDIERAIKGGYDL